MVRRQPLAAAPHVRQGEHRIGSVAHGRAHAAHPCNGCADSDGRALAINGQLIGEWFGEQFDRLFSSIRKSVISPRSRKSLRQ